MNNIKLDETIYNKGRLVMTILWPSFLMAGIAVGIIFSLIDPDSLVVLGNSMEVRSMFIYSVGFFVFWFLGTISSALTAVLMCKFK
jgi:hypothetical protein